MHSKETQSKERHSKQMAEMPGMYGKLAVMIAVSYVWMYGAMFAMVNTFGEVLQNLNFVYMAGLMAGAMIPIEILMMRAMYKDRRSDLAAFAVAAVILVGSFFGIRSQAAVGDDQFMLAMIPHHSAALLMCREASLSDQAVRDICERPNGIVESQTREIEEMRQLLERRNAARP